MTRWEVLDWVKEEYGTDSEHLWVRYPNYAVLRNRDNKWYGVVMDIPKDKFGIESTDVVDVLNVKADTMLIDVLVNQPGFYRAYHMNKKQWISIFLDGSVPDETIKNLVADSYEMTSKQKRKII